MATQTGFHWFSSQGISVMLFLMYGGFYILIGVLTPFFSESNQEKQGVIISYRTDKKLFGEEPGKLMKDNKSLADLRKIMLPMLAAMLLVSGLLIISIAWFALRTNQAWSLIVLAIAGLVVLPYWWLVFKPYFDVGIRIRLADAPPFIWDPAFLYLPAVILGWIGLR